MYKSLFLVFIAVTCFANDFLSILDNSKYADSGFIAENALFLIAGDIYGERAGNIKGSVEKNGNPHIIINNDTVSVEKFQEQMLLTTNSLYKKKAIELIELYHNWVLTSLYYKNNCQNDNIYMKRTEELAVKLKVLPEYNNMKHELIEFMEKVYATSLSENQR